MPFAEPTHAAEISQFVLKDMTGKALRLADFKGKWVLINYWATWCPPCLEEIPDLVNLHDQYKESRLVVIGIAFDYKSPQEVTRFVDDMLISYPIVLGTPEIAAQFGSSSILPTSFVFNPEGHLVKTRHGIISRQEIERMLSAPTGKATTSKEISTHRR
jgi:thiol-disulfide isomerase/thioredoxin